MITSMTFRYMYIIWTITPFSYSADTAEFEYPKIFGKNHVFYEKKNRPVRVIRVRFMKIPIKSVIIMVPGRQKSVYESNRT